MEKEKTKLEDVLRQTNENDTAKEILRIVDLASVFLCIYALFYLEIHLIQKDAWLALRAALILAIPFALVSLVRYLIKAPRPIELFDFYGEDVKKRGSGSFPSRHAFSAFAIGVLVLFFHFTLGLITVVLAALMSASRVLLGKHFPRDVIAGALMGIISSLLGYFIFIT